MNMIYIFNAAEFARNFDALAERGKFIFIARLDHTLNNKPSYGGDHHESSILWLWDSTALAFLAIAIISLEISRQCGSTDSEYVHCERCRKAYHDRHITWAMYVYTCIYMEHEWGSSWSKHEEIVRCKKNISGTHWRSVSVAGVRARANNTQRQRKTYFRNLHILPALHKLN